MFTDERHAIPRDDRSLDPSQMELRAEPVAGDPSNDGVDLVGADVGHLIKVRRGPRVNAAAQLALLIGTLIPGDRLIWVRVRIRRLEVFSLFLDAGGDCRR